MDEFVIDPNQPILNQELKVADLNCVNDCLIGMDIIKKVPKLNEPFIEIQKIVNEFSQKNESLETETHDIFCLSKSSQEEEDA